VILGGRSDTGVEFLFENFHFWPADDHDAIASYLHATALLRCAAALITQRVITSSVFMSE
jgi:hypothetical protein